MYDSDVTIIIPTYNEADCIAPLFNQLHTVLADGSFDYTVLVVDDDSPDETADEVRRLAGTHEYPAKVHVRTENPGLGESVVDGLRVATSEICVVMDADLQHPPSAVPRLVSEITSTGADIAVGSRKVASGSLGDWSMTRRVISWGADMLSQIAVPIARDVSDPMSGLFAVRRDQIPVTELNPRGFKILLELISVIDDPEIREVGYQFGTREYGESKLTTWEYVDFLEHLAICRVRASPLADMVVADRAVQIGKFSFVDLLRVVRL